VKPPLVHRSGHEVTCRYHEAYVGDMTKSMQDALCEIAAEEAAPELSQRPRPQSNL
jgi:hypothetical protein